MISAPSTVNIFLHFITALETLDSPISPAWPISSIYEIVISTSADKRPLVTHVFDFLREGEYPSGMSFVRLGHLLYFMGGSIDYITACLSLDCYKDDNEPLTATLYPPDVYVFDTETSKLLDSSSPYWIPPMVSGKPKNPIVFVVNDRIYVLSSQDGPRILTHFETFDPVSRKWEKLQLPDPDFFSETKCAQGSFVNGDALLVTYLSEQGEFDVLTYSIKSGFWTHRGRSSFLPTILRNPLFVGGSLYSLVNDKIHFMNADCIPYDTLLESFYNLEEFGHSFSPYPMEHCLLDDRRPDVDTDTCLFHFGELYPVGSNESTTYLGFVEFVRPDFGSRTCGLRPVLLKVIEGKPPEFIHVSRIPWDIPFYCSLTGAACVPS